MKRRTRSGPSTASSDDAPLPSLRFHHSEALRSKTLRVLEALETAADPTGLRDALAAVVVELTEAGFDYYFVKAVQAARVGFMAEQSAKLGIASMLRVLGPVIRRIIGAMDANQLRVVTSHMRHLMQ